MSDQPPQPPQSRLQVNVPDDVKHGEYANFLIVSHSAHEFTLDFCQLLPGQQGQAQAEVVSRIRVAPTMVAKVMQSLNQNLTNYEERFGQVKSIP